MYHTTMSLLFRYVNVTLSMHHYYLFIYLTRADLRVNYQCHISIVRY